MPKAKLISLTHQVSIQEVKKVLEGFADRPTSKIRVTSIDSDFQIFWIVLVNYQVDYLRYSTNSIMVDSNVKEVILGNRYFEPIKTTSWSKIEQSIRKTIGVNSKKIPLDLVERAEYDVSKEFTLDYNGKITNTQFTYHYSALSKKASKTLQKIKQPDWDALMTKLTRNFRSSLKNKKKILKENLRIKELYCLRLPIYVAGYKLNGKKKLAKFDAIDLQDITE
ncbi:MAG: hypothetical protein GWN40_10310 [Nitrosopumilaceae archaeon]|nr:hypothetical protein [Nitrosopumilaceae archaeon]NIV66479.1 hypothetical protein [Nitrosopumilaceae archaeon]